MKWFTSFSSDSNQYQKFKKHQLNNEEVSKNYLDKYLKSLWWFVRLFLLVIVHFHRVFHVIAFFFSFWVLWSVSLVIPNVRFENDCFYIFRYIMCMKHFAFCANEKNGSEKVIVLYPSFTNRDDNKMRSIISNLQNICFLKNIKKKIQWIHHSKKLEKKLCIAFLFLVEAFLIIIMKIKYLSAIFSYNIVNSNKIN